MRKLLLFLAVDVGITAVLVAIRRHRNRPHWISELVEPGLVHVYPTRDGIEHDIEGDDCLCGPTSVPLQLEDGSYAWTIEHHALDGREFRERGEEIPRDVVR